MPNNVRREDDPELATKLGLPSPANTNARAARVRQPSTPLRAHAARVLFQRAARGLTPKTEPAEDTETPEPSAT
jgi:hypothetical protein